MSEFKKMYVNFSAITIDRQNKQVSPGTGAIVVDFPKPFSDVADVRELEDMVRAKMSLELQTEIGNVKIINWQRME